MKTLKRKKPAFVALMAIVFCLCLHGCSKQQPPKVYKVGILGVDAFTKMADGFKEQMQELGYCEGENITYDTQIIGSGMFVDEGQILKKFVDEKCDLIFAFPTEPAVAAKKAAAGTNIPIVFSFAGLEGNNLVDSISNPGGNITGVRFTGPDSTAKRLEILHEAAPNAKRIALMNDPNYANTKPSLAALHKAAMAIDVTLVEIPVNSLEEIRDKLSQLEDQNDIGIDAFLMMPDALTHTLDGFKIIIDFANKHKIPVGGGQVYQVQYGAIFGYSPYDKEMGAQAAILADKIFKGAPAGSLPVVSPENHLEINYKAAQQLGLVIPQGMLSRAEKIIR